MMAAFAEQLGLPSAIRFGQGVRSNSLGQMLEVLQAAIACAMRESYPCNSKRVGATSPHPARAACELVSHRR